MEITQENIWEVYSPVFAKITPNMQKYLLIYAASKARGSVLDAGTGVGKLLPYLQLNDNIDNVLAIDSNEFMLKEAKKYTNRHIKTQLGDVVTHKGKYDTIISLNTLHTLDRPIRFLVQSFQNLNPNGTLILSSIKRDHNISEVMNIIDKEFYLEENSDLKDDYELFKKCNFFLTSKNKFKQQLFDTDEMIELLREIGYTIIHTQEDYVDTLFTIVAKKDVYN